MVDPPAPKRAKTAEAEAEDQEGPPPKPTAGADASSDEAGDGTVDANEALTFVYETAFGESLSFHPEMTHQIYGDDETIRGSPGLSVSVRLSPALFAYGSASGGEAADRARALGPLDEAFGGQLYQDEAAWAAAAGRQQAKGDAQAAGSAPTREELGLETLLEGGIWTSVRQGEKGRARGGGRVTEGSEDRMAPSKGQEKGKCTAEGGEEAAEGAGGKTSAEAAAETKTKGDAGAAEGVGERGGVEAAEGAVNKDAAAADAVEGGAPATEEASRKSNGTPVATIATHENGKSADDLPSAASLPPSSPRSSDPSIPQLFTATHPNALKSLKPHEPIPTSGPLPLIVPLDELSSLDAQLLEPTDAAPEPASGLGWDALAAGATEGRPDPSLLIVGGNLKSASAAARALHERFQKLLLFFVDAASLIDQEEPEWELLLAFDAKRERADGGSGEKAGAPAPAASAPLCPVAMATLRVFPAFPDAHRVRVSQVLVLPPFQGRGIGAALSRAAYVRAGQLSARDVTIEDPSEHMAFLDDRTCLRAAFAYASKTAQSGRGGGKAAEESGAGIEGTEGSRGKEAAITDAPSITAPGLEQASPASPEDTPSPLAFIQEAYAAARAVLASRGSSSLRAIPTASPAALASLRDPLLIGFKHARQIWPAAVLAAAGRALGDRGVPETLAAAARAAALRELQDLAEPGTEPALRGPRAKRLKDVEGGFIMCRRSDGEAPEVQVDGEAAPDADVEEEGQTVTPEEAADVRAEAAVTLAAACV